MRKLFSFLIVVLCIIPIECYALTIKIDSGLGILVGLVMLWMFLQYSSNKSMKISKPVEFIEEIGYSKEELEDILCNNLKDVYNSLEKKDMDTLKNLCSLEIYDAYCSQFYSLEFLNRERIIKDFNISKFKIVEIYREKTRIIVKVNVSSSYYSYIVNDKGELIKGRPDVLIKKKWDVVFVKKDIDFDSIKKCPHCLEHSKSDGKGNCLKCKKNIISYKNNFILIKKKSK